jgi:mono/diheme cytochrome c family protein
MNNSAWGLIAFFVIGGGFVIWNAVQPDDGPRPTGGMTTEDTSNIEDGEPLAEVTLPASFSADAKIGKRVFEAKCMQCHGQNAAGQNGVAPPLVNNIYRPAHHGDIAFVLAAKNGVRAHHWKFGNMPRIEGLTDADVGYVARYIRELQQENGIK